MHWQSDVSVADWISPRLSDDWSRDFTMHMAVPRGFDAYARIFHPATRRTVPGGVVPSADDIARMPHDEAMRVLEQFVTARVTWAETAEAFGTTMHALAQWHAVTGATEPYGADGRVNGAEYQGGEEGFLEPELLTAVVQTAVEHTTTPRAGFAAVWEGWGDLVGSMRQIGQRAARFGDDGAMIGDIETTPHESFLARIRKSMMNNPFGKETWHPGILSDDISRGPRLSLPNRDYVLFAMSPGVFMYPTWQESVLWQHPDQTAFTHGPALLWPEDRAWVIVSEIDWDSTVVGGSEELISALLNDDRLEAWRLPAESLLTADADEING